MLGGAEFDDLAALRLDGFARVFLLLHVQGALKRHRFRYGASHGALELGGPGIERRAVEEDRPRDVEVIAQRVEAVEFVHTVSHGVRKRILLRVDGAGGDHRDRLGQIHAYRHRAEQLKCPGLHFAR